jgi:hypothetical protein
VLLNERAWVRKAVADCNSAGKSFDSLFFDRCRLVRLRLCASSSNKLAKYQERVQ